MGVSYSIRRVRSVSEEDAVQGLDTKTWPEGFKRYQALIEKGGDILVAVSKVPDHQIEVYGYIGWERIRRDQLEAMMYLPWDHPVIHDKEGTTLWVVGHAVRKDLWKDGIAKAVVESFIKGAKTDPKIDTLAVICDLDYPTVDAVRTIDAVRYWSRFGFEPDETTRNPYWVRAKGLIPTKGSVITTLDTRI